MNELPLSQLAGSPPPVSPVPRGVREEARADAVRPGRVASEKPARGATAEVRDPEIHLEQLERITDDLNRFFAKAIRFDIANEGHDLVVQVVDRNSDEVIRSIPPEQLVSFREEFREFTGILLDDRA